MRWSALRSTIRQEGRPSHYRGGCSNQRLGPSGPSVCLGGGGEERRLAPLLPARLVDHHVVVEQSLQAYRSGVTEL